MTVQAGYLLCPETEDPRELKTTPNYEDNQVFIEDSDENFCIILSIEEAKTLRWQIENVVDDLETRIREDKEFQQKLVIEMEKVPDNEIRGRTSNDIVVDETTEQPS